MENLKSHFNFDSQTNSAIDTNLHTKFPSNSKSYISELRSLSDQTLLQNTYKLAQGEREILTHILHHLREVERRRLFSSLKYSSLFEYATKELRYSEDQATRRIAAMRLLKELPEVEEKISNGSITLTHLGMAQSLFNKEKKFSHKDFLKEKLEILNNLQNTSTREAEKKILSLSSSPVTLGSERIKPISEEFCEIKFIASQSLQRKLEKLKNLRAHKGHSLSELLEDLCDLGLEKYGKRTKATTLKDKSLISLEKPKKLAADLEILPAAPRVTMRQSQAAIKREVWQRDQSKCQNCGSQYALEIDHINPKALGGEDTIENMRLLCRSCNQRAAIEVFGVKKMERYLDS